MAKLNGTNLITIFTNKGIPEKHWEAIANAILKVQGDKLITLDTLKDLIDVKVLFDSRETFKVVEQYVFRMNSIKEMQGAFNKTLSSLKKNLSDCLKKSGDEKEKEAVSRLSSFLSVVTSIPVSGEIGSTTKKSIKQLVDYYDLVPSFFKQEGVDTGITKIMSQDASVNFKNLSHANLYESISLKFPLKTSDIIDFTEKLNFAYQTSEENFVNILSKSMMPLQKSITTQKESSTEKALTSSLRETNKLIRVANIIDKKYL